MKRDYGYETFINVVIKKLYSLDLFKSLFGDRQGYVLVYVNNGLEIYKIGETPIEEYADDNIIDYIYSRRSLIRACRFAKVFNGKYNGGVV